jgi:hypothetical protein
MDVGEMEVVVGTGFFTVKVCAPDVPPPGAGFTTVMESVPPTVMSTAGMVIVMVVLDTNVVANGAPLKSTVDDALKFVPVTVSVKLFPPAVVDVGETELVVGTGLFIVSVCAFDVPPPGVGLTTVIDAVPPTAMSAAGTVAVSCVDEANVVAKATPLKLTVDDAIKFVPVTVRMKDKPPAVVDAGLMETVVGTGLLYVAYILQCSAEDVPPVQVVGNVP